jgi:hypothetical protein
MVDAVMPDRPTAECDIRPANHHVRAFVGAGLAHEVQACYRSFVNECLQRQCERALIVGESGADAFVHLAARDAIHSMVVAGVPAGFRLAFVAADPGMIAVYDAAVVEARRNGMEARRFSDEASAEQWLSTTHP